MSKTRKFIAFFYPVQPKSLLFLLLCGIFFIPFTAEGKPCAFCNPKVIESQQVLTSEHFHLLLDYEPRVDGHLLAIPKRHIAKAEEMLEEEWAELSAIIPQAARAFSELLNAEDYIVLEKNGPLAFQQVPHVHFHLIPMTGQPWQAVFGNVPNRLPADQLQVKVNLFQSYFAACKRHQQSENKEAPRS